MDNRMGKGRQAWRSTDTPHKNNLWALHTGHTLKKGIQSLASYWL